VVENRPARRHIGTDFVAKAAPTAIRCFRSDGELIINPLIGKVRTNPRILRVTLMAKAPNALGAHPPSPQVQVKELIALARSQPGRINYGSAAMAARRIWRGRCSGHGGHSAHARALQSTRPQWRT